MKNLFTNKKVNEKEPARQLIFHLKMLLPTGIKINGIKRIGDLEYLEYECSEDTLNTPIFISGDEK